MKSSLLVLCLICGLVTGCKSATQMKPESEIEASAKCALMGARLREYHSDKVYIFGIKLWETHNFSCEFDRTQLERKILGQILYPD